MAGIAHRPKGLSLGRFAASLVRDPAMRPYGFDRRHRAQTVGRRPGLTPVTHPTPAFRCGLRLLELAETRLARELDDESAVDGVGQPPHLRFG